MSDLISSKLSGMLEMQKDILSDGEMPVPLSETAYYSELYVNAEEMPEELATPLAKAMLAEAHEYTVTNNLFRGAFEHGTKWTKISIYSYIGDHLFSICFEAGDYVGQTLVLRAIADKYPRILFI